MLYLFQESQKIGGDMNLYYSTMFEFLVEDLMRDKSLDLGFSFTGVGRWWHKEREIDLVALGDEITGFFEVKWGALGLRDSMRVLADLVEKSEYTGYRSKQSRYGLIAGEIRGKEKLRDEGFICYDLTDL
ncbi:MAG: DUF234 domain-containing protein [Candidatus Altiarchaeota archaeon]|nr:DUF234 domain-containing protein [Candidatus Altiarchaeota archaeon]